MYAEYFNMITGMYTIEYVQDEEDEHDDEEVVVALCVDTAVEQDEDEAEVVDAGAVVDAAFAAEKSSSFECGSGDITMREEDRVFSVEDEDEDDDDDDDEEAHDA